MRRFRTWLVVLSVAVLLFGAGAVGFAQSTETEDDLEELEGDPAVILAKLAEEFEVDEAELLAYFDAGASPGEIWLALEISANTAMPLADAIVLAEGSDGHGWGVLAQVLGIKPGSDEFFALKGKVNNRGIKLSKQVREAMEERAKKEKESKGDKPEKEGGQGNGTKGGKN